MDELYQLAIDAAKRGGAQILSVYRHNISIDLKADGSPLTLADKLSNDAIGALLSESLLPIVSEENIDLHMQAKRYFLVDPLDGTKDFLAANAYFTVNIALIENDYPVFGVLYAPALDELYVGYEDAIFYEQRGARSILTPEAVMRSGLHMATSVFHDCEQSRKFAFNNHVTQTMAVGSALKFGRIAKGDIDIYPRFVGTSEWDTAAGQAVLEAAGGQVIDLTTKQRMRYGKPKRRSGSFLAFRSPYTFNQFNVES